MHELVGVVPNDGQEMKWMVEHWRLWIKQMQWVTVKKELNLAIRQGV
jgi:hypothetical protein